MCKPQSQFNVIRVKFEALLLIAALLLSSSDAASVAKVASTWSKGLLDSTNFQPWDETGASNTVSLLRREERSAALTPDGTTVQLQQDLAELFSGSEKKNTAQQKQKKPTYLRWFCGICKSCKICSDCDLPKGVKASASTKDDVTKLFVAGEPMLFLRWGDGNFDCAFDIPVVNANGEKLVKQNPVCQQLRKDLGDFGKQAKERTNMFIMAATQWLCKETHANLHDAVEKFFTTGSAQPQWGGFVGANERMSLFFPLVPESKPGRQRSVVPVLANRVVAVVGPAHLRKLHSMLGWQKFIEIPRHGWWDERERVVAAMRDFSKHHPGVNVVFLVAGGVGTGPVVYPLFREEGNKDSFIDVGSSLDGFAGIASRDYNSKDGFRKKLCGDYPEYVAPGVC